jgi:predicted N-acyltransferase
MTVSARSAAIAFADVVFEDDWLAVIDKPAGVYYNALLTSFPCPAVSGKKRLNLKRICF